MSGVQLLAVDAEGDDQRLDRWVRKRFPQVTQGRLEKLCRKGEIRVDGGRVKPATRLAEGQTVRLPPLPDAPPPAPAAEVDPADAAMIRATVIHRDDHVLALNKPAGLAVQGGSGVTRHVDGLAPALAFGGEPPRLVHRLDRDTSGVLILGRTGRATAALAKSFHARTTRKIYWALVAGVPSPRAGTIRYGLAKQAGHGPHGAGEKMVPVHPGRLTPEAKPATTDYMVVEALGTRAAFVALVPVTGRTHQLRAHMAAIGHPIAGDGKYGGSGQQNLGDGWGAGLGGGLSRKLHLHARRLEIPHPVSGARLVLTAPLSEHMARSWEALGLSSDITDPFEDL